MMGVEPRLATYKGKYPSPCAIMAPVTKLFHSFFPLDLPQMMNEPRELTVVGASASKHTRIPARLLSDQKN